MMSNQKRMLYSVLFLSLSVLASAQVFESRYFESPAISWNETSMHNAAQLSLGGIFLFADGSLSQIANPALFSEITGVEPGFSYSFVSYQSYQFWGINEGVRAHPDPMKESLGYPSLISVKFSFPGISVSAGWYRSALNDFPDFTFRNEYDYDQYDEFSGSFSGFTENYFISAGIPLSKKISAGVKIRYSRGSRKAEIADTTSYYYFLDGYWQLKSKVSETAESERSEIFIPELGLIYDLNKKWRAGLRVRYPLTGKVNRTINRSLSNSDGLNIYDDHTYEDEYYGVPEITAGVTHRVEGIRAFGVPGVLRAGAELGYRGWSQYRLLYFGEEEERDLSDTLKAAFGAEYKMSLKKADIFLRLGFNLDKQPRKDADSMLKNYSAGMGIRYKDVEFGVGFLYTRGSAGGIGQNHMTVCSSLSKKL